jgi:leader peptidase (prepilin peptidase)/N-methyltransferase
MNAAESAFVARFGIVVAFLLGMNVGSFLNVVAHRLPLGLSVVRPRSRCPCCLTPIAATDNIPVLSWLLLGGRCRGCRTRISGRYASVELLTGALGAWAAWALVADSGRADEGAAWAHAAIVFVALAAMTAASLVDLDHRILPDEITLPGMWAGPPLAALLPELLLGPTRDAPEWVPAAWPAPLQAALVSAAGLAVGGGVIWGIGAVGTRALGKEAMGFGDVKFLAAIGGFAGPVGALLALVVAAAVGAVVGIVRLSMTGDRYIPFGPFLAVGGAVAMLHGPQIVGWYLGLAT